MDRSDPRLECASKHADAIGIAAEALSTAIYEASRDGYRVSLQLRHIISVGDMVFVGDGESAATVKATVAFDIGRKVAL